MPELPEVETVRRSLRPWLVDRTIERVHVHAPALREPLDREALEALTGRRVVDLWRRAKYLLIDVEGERSLAIHLGMSGRLTVVPRDEPVARHEHVAFDLDADPARDGATYRLRLVDPRRFGQAFVLPTAGVGADRHFAHLGAEPVDTSAGRTEPEAEGDRRLGEHLAAGAEGRRGPMKAFLMDARVVVGVGNIYASEVLWLAKVHPTRSVARVSGATWQRLASAVRSVLMRAIGEGGTTLADFADGEGNAGYFQVSLAVYGREGEPCLRCERAIRRIVQSNRSTFYCPGCQR